MTDINLAAYLARINHQGALAPTLPVLRALQRHHVMHIPFEDLDSFQGRGVSLGLADIEAKLITRGRGGYCYEHGLLFRNILEQLGFQVRGLLARVYWGAAEDARPARSHMLLQVTIDDIAYVVDTGFGVMTGVAPLRLDQETRQPTSHETFRIRHEDGIYTQQALDDGHWRTLYRFDLNACWPADYEVANWFTSRHASSRFVSDLIATRVDANCRHILRNNHYSVRYPDGRTLRQELDSPAAVLAVLEDTMRIRLPNKAQLRKRLEEQFASRNLVPSTAIQLPYCNV